MSQRNLGLITPFSWFLGGVYLFIILPLNVWSNIQDLPNLENWSKPILMLWLILIVLQGKLHLNSSIKIGLFLALLFSWIGDVSLLFVEFGEGLFLMGLGSFLLAHICYILVMMRSSTKIVYNSFVVKLGMPVLIVFTITLLFILFPFLNEFTLPVMLYAFVLLLMGIVSIGRQAKRGYAITVFGVMLFILSDSILAIAKFTPYLENQGAWIMITYGLAQIMILFGILSNISPDPEVNIQDPEAEKLLLNQQG